MASCTIQSFTFSKNGSTIITPCTASTADVIKVSTSINLTFASGETSTSLYAYFIVKYPDGNTHGYYANNGNAITYTLNGVHEIQLTSADGFSTITSGNYSLQSITILDGSKAQTLCYSTTPTNCPSLNVSSGGSGGGSGLCGSSVCDTTKNFCLAGSCIPQIYVYGAFGLFIFMMMMKR